MKQKIMIEMQIDCEKCRSKAMKLVASATGVESVAIEGKDKDRVVVVGDGVDPINLTSALRKKVGYANIISVEEVKQEVEKKPATPQYPPACPVILYERPCDVNTSSCSVM